MHRKQHGIAGSLDVMKVHWGNCPTAWKGQFKGKEDVPTIALEAMADYNLWFWHDCFGFPGALNDLNIWERSTLYEAFQNGSLFICLRPLCIIAATGTFFRFAKLLLSVASVFSVFSG